MPYRDRTPKYKQIAAELTALIQSDGYAPGDPFLSVREIGERFGVAHKTASAAYGVLRDRHLIEGSNAGTIVARSVAGAHERLARIRAGKGLNRGGETSTILAAAYVEDPRVSVAENFEAHELPLVMRRYVTASPAGRVTVYGTSWISGVIAAMCPALLVAEPLANGILGEIAARTGRHVTPGPEGMPVTYAAGSADLAEAEMLGVVAGAPVLRVRTICLEVDDATGKRAVLEYNEAVHPSEFWVGA